MKTEVLKIVNDSSDTEKIQAAARIVNSSGLVAFPTETVYGIACLAKTNSISALDAVKGRPHDKRYTLHVPSKSRITEYVPKIQPGIRKLIENALPGPITLVFETEIGDLNLQRQTLGEDSFEILYRNGTIGIRCPDNPIARRLLEAVDGPVVAPSANLSGGAPATTAREVLEALDGKINMILDGDDWAGCRFNKSSTVVKINRKNIQILRQGAITKEQIEEMSTIRILFVCTGNTCRSPMAEYFCRKTLSEKLDCTVDEVDQFGYKVTSAGIMAYDGMAASREVVEICRERGIDASGHQSSLLDISRIKQSDYIFALSTGHRNRILEICPEAVEKCFLLDENGDIPDPFGADEKVYRNCAGHIAEALDKRICEIWNEDSSSK